MGLLRRKHDGDVVIDLTEAEKPAPKMTWGMPSPCPSCGGRGYLDHIDPYREVMFEHCTECFSKWEIARADVDASATA
jgi:hypothetical protein